MPKHRSDQGPKWPEPKWSNAHRRRYRHHGDDVKVAAWCCCLDDFCMKWLLHFCKFLINPNFILNLFFGQRTNVSNDILSVWNYCQLFTHESNTFMFLKNMPFKSMGEKNPQSPSSLGACELHQIYPSQTDLTHHPKWQLTQFTHFHQTTQQSPQWLQWDAQIHSQNCPFPFDDHHPYLIHPSLTDPIHHHKRHPDAINGFARVHFWTDRHTQRDRPTDGISKKRIPKVLTLYYVDREWCSNKIT